MKRSLALVWTIVALCGGAVASDLPVLVADDFDSLDAWTLEGESFAHECAGTATGVDCHVRIAPACCGTYTTATRALEMPVHAPTSISIRFSGDVLWGDVDSELAVVYSGSSDLLFRATDGWGDENNGFSLDTPWGQSGRFGAWDTTDAWYELRLDLDPLAETVTARVFDASGYAVAQSEALPAGAIGSLDEVRIQNAAWGDGGSYAWDKLVIAPTPIGGAVALTMR